MRLVAETFADEIYSDSDWVSSISNLTRFNRRRGQGFIFLFNKSSLFFGSLDLKNIEKKISRF